MKAWKGYSSSFMGDEYVVDLPCYDFYTRDIARNINTDEEVIPYQHFSIIQSKSRKVPIVSASNVYRTRFVQTVRTGSFKKDPRLDKDHQLSSNDYRKFNAIKAAIIEKGHMTKREDVQWCERNNARNAQAAAASTFYYPNAVPQHDRLNNGIWKNLENSIIIKGHVPMPARIGVFTGPVLSSRDPAFDGQLTLGASFQIPVLFWKVVYYIKPDTKLYCASFLIGQESLLIRDKIVTSSVRKSISWPSLAGDKEFLAFNNDQNYQVPITLIQTLTKLSFAKAIDLHKGKKPAKLSLMQAMSIGDGITKTRVPLVDGINV